MIRVKVKNIATQAYTHGAEFESNELADQWIERQASKKPCPWGKLGSFEIEKEDITAQVEQENRRATRRKQAIQAIRSFDPETLTTVAQVRGLLKEILEVLK